VPASVTVGAITAVSNISRTGTNTVQVLFAIPATAGMTNVVVTFNLAPTYTLTNGITIN
jgi:hypothetical protein